jgi:hypothetical protein
MESARSSSARSPKVSFCFIKACQFFTKLQKIIYRKLRPSNYIDQPIRNSVHGNYIEGWALCLGLQLGPIQGLS